jgi:1-acyl-sn-glycerol-3-phosphate acyltransferase
MSQIADYGRALVGRTLNQALKRRGLTREQFAYKVLPSFFLDIIQRYLRVRTEGLSNIPSDGPYIIIANHSGYMGFDALMLAHQVHNFKNRVPRVIAHKLWFLHPEISVHATKLGLIPATYANGLKILQMGEPLILFPEGEEGNFKPSRSRYRLRRFRRGFVRLALATGVPIIPAVVIGAEETHITLSQIRWAKQVLGIIVPVPLNVVPLPAKWTIRFLKPIRLRGSAKRADDIEYVTKVSRHVRLKLQKALHAQLKKRDRIFI